MQLEICLGYLLIGLMLALVLVKSAKQENKSVLKSAAIGTVIAWPLMIMVFIIGVFQGMKSNKDKGSK